MSNPLACHSDDEADEDMTDTALQLAALSLKGSSGKYAGEPGPACLDFLQDTRRRATEQCAKSLRDGRDTPHASILLQAAMDHVQVESEPHEWLKQARMLVKPDMTLAQGGIFPSHILTADQRNHALGDNSGLGEYEKLLSNIMLDSMGELCTEAHAVGRLSQPGGAGVQPPPPAAGGASASGSGPALQPGPDEQQGGADDEAADQAAAAAALRLRAARSAPINTSPLMNGAGELRSAHMAVLDKVLLMFEARFGTASAEQEYAFKISKQGERTVDAWAYHVQYWHRALRHRAELTADAVANIFLDGLNDGEIAKQARMSMINAPLSDYTVQTLLSRVRHCVKLQFGRQQVQTERQVAQSMLDKAKAAANKAGGSGGAGSGGTPKPAALKRQMLELASRLDPNDPMAPCKLGGKHAQQHTNSACPDQQHTSQQQRIDMPAGLAAAAADDAGAAAVPAAAGAQLQQAPAPRNNAGPNRQRAGGSYQPPQQQQQRNMAPPGPQQGVRAAAGAGVGAGPSRCRTCNLDGGHGTNVCWYEHPQLARAGWKMSLNAPLKAVQVCLQKCKDLNIPPPLEADQRPLLMAAAAATPAGGPASAAVWEDAAGHDPSEGEGWFSGGMVAVDYGSDGRPGGSSSSSSSVAMAGTRGRGQPPRSFVPPNNSEPLLPRAAGRVHAAAGLAGMQGGSGCSSITLALHDGEALQILQQLLSARDPRILNSNAAAAGTQEWDQPYSCAANATAADAVLDSLADACLQGTSFNDLFESYSARSRDKTLHFFNGATPEESVSLENGSGRSLGMIPRAVEDSGCVPNLITESYAKAIGLHYRELAPSELPRIRNIEGEVVGRVFARTEPVSVIFAKGTQHEARLDVPDGFVVMRGGGAAADLYDVVLGRSLLGRISGFVQPLIQRFVYMPRLQARDVTMHTLPVKIGLDRLDGPLAPHAAAAGFMGASSSGSAIHATVHAAGGCGDDEGSDGDRATRHSSSSNDAPSATTAPAKGWGVQGLLSMLMLLPLLPFIAAGNLACWVVRSVSSAACLLAHGTTNWLAGCYSKACALPPYARSTLYWRLGRHHRASNGERIQLQCPPGHSGNKPKVVRVHKRTCTWAYLRGTLPAKLAVLLLTLLAVCLTSTAAVRIATLDTASGGVVPFGMGSKAAAFPFSAGDVLAWSISSGQHCFRGGWF